MMDIFHQRSKEHGLKITPQRTVIYQCLRTGSGRPKGLGASLERLARVGSSGQQRQEPLELSGLDARAWRGQAISLGLQPM